MGSHAFHAPPPGEINQVLDALRRIVRFLRMPAKPGRAADGLSSAQFFVLAQLKDTPARSIRDLAQRTMSDPSSVSVVVTKLVAQGLVARVADRRDNRRAVLSLTPRGKRMLARAPELPQVRIIDALAEMPKAQRKAIARSLDELVHAIGAHTVRPRLFFEDEPKAKKGVLRGQG